MMNKNYTVNEIIVLLVKAHYEFDANNQIEIDSLAEQEGYLVLKNGLYAKQIIDNYIETLLTNKSVGKDCTEQQSGELKQHIRRLMNLFPIEFSEASEERN